MKISTQTAGMARVFGDTKAIEMLCELGYDCLDFSMFWKEDSRFTVEADDILEKAAQYRKIAQDYNVTFNQTHAPFPSYLEDDDKYNEWIKPLIIKAIEVSGALGAKHVIIHPINLTKNQKEFNMEFFKSLAPHAKKANVKIAIENMFGWSDEKQKLVKNVCSDGPEMCDYIDSLNDACGDYFVACLDIGHCGLVGESAPEMIRQLGHDRLKALHVHDNDHINDLHTLPFLEKIDFPAVMKALKDVDYDGELTLEADYFLETIPDALKIEASRLMEKTARYLTTL